MRCLYDRRWSVPIAVRRESIVNDAGNRSHRGRRGILASLGEDGSGDIIEVGAGKVRLGP